MIENKKPSAYKLLRKKYPAEECVLISEVSDTTGGRNRSADHIVINLWPSRGNAIIGFEVKSWRNDWLREMKDPDKQEAIFKFCDYFYLLTDVDNVAKIDEIPETWGWMHVEKNYLKVMKQAPKLEPVPLTKKFVCAMLRRAAAKEGFVHIDSIEDKIEEAIAQHERETERNNKKDLDDYKVLKEKVEQFEKASGIILSNRWDYNNGEKIGKAVNLVMGGEVDRIEKRLGFLKTSAKEIVQDIDKELKKFNKEPEVA